MAASSGAERRRVRAATPTDVSAAIAARRRREYIRHLKVMAAGLALATSLAVAIWLVGYSPVLAGKQVEVRGNQLATSAQVLEKAQVPRGTPLSRLDTEQIAQRVATLPTVEHAEVRVQWPSTVVVEVTERTAVFQRRAGTAWQLVDAHGVIFASRPKAEQNLLEMTCDRVNNQLLAGAATVVASLTPDLRSQAVRLEAPGQDQMVLRLKSGQQVLWGDAGESPTKAHVAQALVGQEKFTVLNVSSPANPTAR